MILGALHFLRDMCSYASMGWNRTRLARHRRGDDYREEGYREIASRTACRIHPRSMKLKVVDVIDESPSTRTLRLVRTDGNLPPFSAGQYVNVFLNLDGTLTSRPYSISSAPGEPHLDLTVRLKPGGFVSGHLQSVVSRGDEFETTGPAGWFRYEKLIDGDDLVFLAGGSGITPFMSMLRDFAAKGGGPRVHLLYGNRSPDDIPFEAAIEELAGRLGNLTVTHVMSEPPEGYLGATGLLDAARITESVDDPAGKMFYICGPGAMLDLCCKALKELGVGLHRIRTELYGPPEDVTTLDGWPAEIAGDHLFDVVVNDGPPFEAAAGEPLINSLERNGIVVPAVCRSGECSACRMRVVSGDVFVPEDTGVREADRSAGYAHACMTYPVSDIHIRLRG